MVGPTPGLPDSPFWRFSLDIYGRPGVAASCLALQDRHGVDVNLLLLAIWLGCQGRRLDPAAGGHLRRRARRWQGGVIAPLRQARRRLRHRLGDAGLPWPGEVAEVRRRLAALELELEHVEQLELERLVVAGMPESEHLQVTCDNLAQLGMVGILASPDLQALLGAAFTPAAKGS